MADLVLLLVDFRPDQGAAWCRVVRHLHDLTRTRICSERKFIRKTSALWPECCTCRSGAINEALPVEVGASLAARNCALGHSLFLGKRGGTK